MPCFFRLRRWSTTPATSAVSLRLPDSSPLRRGCLPRSVARHCARNAARAASQVPSLSLISRSRFRLGSPFGARQVRPASQSASPAPSSARTATAIGMSGAEAPRGAPGRRTRARAGQRIRVGPHRLVESSAPRAVLGSAARMRLDHHAARCEATPDGGRAPARRDHGCRREGGNGRVGIAGPGCSCAATRQPRRIGWAVVRPPSPPHPTAGHGGGADGNPPERFASWWTLFALRWSAKPWGSQTEGGARCWAA